MPIEDVYQAIATSGEKDQSPENNGRNELVLDVGKSATDTFKSMPRPKFPVTLGLKGRPRIIRRQSSMS